MSKFWWPFWIFRSLGSRYKPLYKVVWNDYFLILLTIYWIHISQPFPMEKGYANWLNFQKRGICLNLYISKTINATVMIFSSLKLELNGEFFILWNLSSQNNSLPSLIEKCQTSDPCFFTLQLVLIQYGGHIRNKNGYFLILKCVSKLNNHFKVKWQHRNSYKSKENDKIMFNIKFEISFFS